MSTDYNYDEEGQFFPYFILTICILVTLPMTYSALKSEKELENTAPRIHSDFRPPADVHQLVEAQKRKQRRQQRKLKRMLAAVAGWLLSAYMMYLIAGSAKSAAKIWDPYDILGISRSASERAIKTHYRRLVLKFHPDKVRPDSKKGETAESLNNRFVEMTKAYKVLTDEDTRNNYMMYGHPDGKQSFSIGIALPKVLVTQGSGKYVLMVYGLLLGVYLPYVVGRWWYGTQRMTREGVLVASAGKLFREYDEEAVESEVLSALSVGEEYEASLKGEKAMNGIGAIESRIFASDAHASRPLLTTKERAGIERLESGVRRKVLGLLWAYLGRVDLGSHILNDEKFEVAPLALALNESFMAIALAYGNTDPVLASFRTSQQLIQAIPPRGSPLLQLPYFTAKVAQAIEGPAAKTHFSVQRFMRMPEDERRRLATAPGLLSDSQYQSAVAVARQIPVLQVEKAFFKVVGERFVTPNSLVQFVVKARIVPPGTAKLPEVSEAELDDPDPEEGDINALIGRGRGSSKKVKMADATSTTAAAALSSGGAGKDGGAPQQPPLAFAPYFARDHSPRWHVFLADSKQGKIAVPPFTFASFDRPLLDAQGRATLAVQTLKMQFQAPPQAGRYTFVMHLVCDSYVDTDTKMEVTMMVEDMARAEEMAGEDEISEPDEDSLAGQMNALKTGGLKGAASGTRRSKKKRATAATGKTTTTPASKAATAAAAAGKGAAAAAAAAKEDDDEDEEDSDEEEEDDESDTEGDEDDDDGSETNTDTDTEDEKEK